MSVSEQNGGESLVLDDLLGGLGSAILESIRIPFGIFRKDFKVLWLNKALARIHRCRVEKVIGEFCYRAFHGCDRICEDCFIDEVLTSGRTVVLEKSHDFPDGKTRWGEIHAYPVREKSGSVAAVIVIIFETTSRIDQLTKHQQYSSFLSDKLSRSREGEAVPDTPLSRKELPLSAELSRRETEVLRLLVDGYTNPQISEMLCISSNTVKRHISNIFLKLDVSDRTQAAVRAVREKMV